MTFGSVVGILLTLAFVLALLGVVLKLLRRFAPAAATGARLRMEVVQRLALGPKQGIAVIRVGERLVAVSVGEGGINRLFELDEKEVQSTAPRGAVPQEETFDLATEARPTSPLDFKAAFRSAMRTAGLAVTVAVLLGSMAPRNAHAQQRRTAAAARRITPPAAAGHQNTRNTGAANAGSANAGTTNAGTTAAPAAATSAPQTTSATPAAGDQPHSLLDANISKLAPQMDLKVGNGDGLHLSGTVGVVVMMGLMTLLPTLLLMMTGFTRIYIVLNFLRQALGTQSAPPTQLVAALSLLLTGFVMAPTLNELNRTALTPWMDGKIDQAQMLDLGAKPFRDFMLRQTRRADIETFVRISHTPAPATVNDVPLVTLTSAFVISELRTAFQIGFALFLPFIVIDVAVSSVLMSMGMFMLPPAMISLPFKLLLFVLVDGWSLIVQSLVTSFR